MGSKKTRFRKVIYKGVEVFFHRDRNRKPVRLRLYDALSGWVLASELTPDEAHKYGTMEYVAGRNRRELLQLLERRFATFSREVESLKVMLTRLRRDYPAEEREEIIRNAYLKATRRSRPQDGAIHRK